MKFLDIRITDEEYINDNDDYNFINIEENYFAGDEKIKQIYPDMINCIKKVNNPKKEVERIISNTKQNLRKRLKNRPLLKRFPNLVTYVLIGLCVINYLLGLYFKFKYSDDISSVLVLLGADYKTFTLGLKQYYRLISYVFVHNDIFHLLCNCISLYTLGSFVESKYGHIKYLLTVIFTAIIGGLTQGILTDNTLCCGISSVIYGLLLIFILNVLKTRIINIRLLLPTIVINLLLNFMSNIAWMAHLGGTIAGLACYFLLENNKNIGYICLCISLLLCLTYKYVTINSISSFYSGTDINVIKIIDDLGFNQYAIKLMNKLINVYVKYGG